MPMNSAVHELSIQTMNSFWQQHICCINTDQVSVFLNIISFVLYTEPMIYGRFYQTLWIFIDYRSTHRFHRGDIIR